MLADFEAAIQEGELLADAGEPDSRARTICAAGGCWNSHSMIGHCECEHVGIPPEAYLRGFAFRMAVYIGQRLLHDPEQGDFHQGSQPADVVADIQRNIDRTAFRKALDEPLQRGSEPKFIEKGWVKRVGNGPYIADAIVNQILAFRKVLGSFFRAGWERGFEQPEIHGKSAQILPGGIVKVVGKPPSFLVLSLQQLGR